MAVTSNGLPGTVVIVKSIIPALGLSKKSDSALNTYAGERINDLTVNEDSFTGLKPTVADVTAQRLKFSGALDKQQKGNKSTTTAKNNERAKLEQLLTLQSQNCAEIADGNVELYQLSGYGIKSKGSPSGQLDAPRDFRVMNGESGSINCKFKGVDNNHGYELVVTNEDGSITKVITDSGSPVTVYDLTPLKRYKVKCRATGARGIKGEWTPELTISVI
jgi:hypothetical protein